MNTDAEHQEIRSDGTIAGYTLDKTAPKTATEANLLTITFYDDYGFSIPAGLSHNLAAGYNVSPAISVKSLVTGGRVKTLPGSSTAELWLTSVTYYDTEYRPIQTAHELYDLGNSPQERVSTLYKYDLAAVAAEQKTEHLFAGILTNSHIATYDYDHADRLLRVKEKVTIGSKTKTAYTLAQRYNILGQLQSKWFHGYAANPTKYRRRTDYTNNIMGWLTDAKTSYQQVARTDLPFYAFGLTYNNVLYAAQYSNGNMSSMKWSGMNEATLTKGLSFTYDNANRLNASTGLSSYADTESGITYDANGNIKTLTRAGAAADSLTYSYLGNQLSAIADASPGNTGVKSGTSSYSYDANGNMLTDGNRAATLTYNYLNLPKTVVTGGKTLTYDYDAGGNKHKYVADTLTVKYAGIFEYNAANVVKRVATSDGQLLSSGDTLRFDYFLKDHLGNVRVVFDERGNILQKNDYYPFGLSIDRNVPVATQAARNGVNRYLYNGKELQVGSGFVDYGARMYMPEIGRMGSMDGAADLFEHVSPYSYALNNPLSYVDPSGDTTINIKDFATTPYNPKKDEVLLDEATIKNSTNADYSAPQPGTQVMFPVSGFWGWVGHYWSSRTYDGNVVDGQGILTNQIVPITGTPPDVGFGQMGLITKILNPKINITQKGLAHTLDRHTINQITKWFNKSKFDDASKVQDLILQATQQPMIRQTNGNYARIVDAGKIIGTDRSSGHATSIYTVITNAVGDLVTSFPGKP